MGFATKSILALLPFWEFLVHLPLLASGLDQRPWLLTLHYPEHPASLLEMLQTLGLLSKHRSLMGPYLLDNIILNSQDATICLVDDQL